MFRARFVVSEISYPPFIEAPASPVSGGPGLWKGEMASASPPRPVKIKLNGLGDVNGAILECSHKTLPSLFQLGRTVSITFEEEALS